MKINLKASVFSAIFIIGIISPGGNISGQICRRANEFSTAYGLRDVMVTRTDPTLRPEFFIFPGKAVTRDQSDIAPLRWQKAGDMLMAPGHSLIGVYTFGAAPAAKDEPQAYDFKVFDTARREIFKLSGRLLVVTERPFCFLTDSKLALITCSYWGDELRFYDQQGQLLNERRLLQEGTLSLITPKGVFDESGHQFLFNLSRARAEEEKIGPDLFMFSSNGSRIWQYQLPLKSTDAIGLSGSGRIAVVCGSVINRQPPQSLYQTILFDSLGNILNSFPVSFRHYDFDREDNWLLLGGNYTASLVSLIKKSIYLELTPGSGRRVITDCALLAGNLVLVVTGLESSRGGEPLYDDPEILIYSPEGQLLYREIFENDYSYLGKLVINNVRNQFGLTLQNRFLVFEVFP